MLSTAQLGSAKIALAQLFSLIFLSKMNEAGYISLVILDLVMPKISGVQVFYEIRNINSTAKVLIVSGYSVDGQAQSMLDAGAAGFMQKPFTFSQLKTKIAEVLS